MENLLFLILFTVCLIGKADEIYLKTKDFFGPKGNIVPGELGMKLVSQNYDLMPYLTVAEKHGKFI